MPDNKLISTSALQAALLADQTLAGRLSVLNSAIGGGKVVWQAGATRLAEAAIASLSTSGISTLIVTGTGTVTDLAAGVATSCFIEKAGVQQTGFTNTLLPVPFAGPWNEPQKQGFLAGVGTFSAAGAISDTLTLYLDLALRETVVSDIGPASYFNQRKYGGLPVIEGVALSTVFVSDFAVMRGLESFEGTVGGTPTTYGQIITVEGETSATEIQVNGGAFTSAAQTCKTGDIYRVKITSAATYGTKTTGIVRFRSATALYDVSGFSVVTRNDSRAPTTRLVGVGQAITAANIDTIFDDFAEGDILRFMDAVTTAPVPSVARAAFLRVNKPGSPTARIIIEGNPALTGTSRPVLDIAGNHDFGIHVWASNVTIRNLHVKNCDSTCFRPQLGNNIWVEDCIASDSPDGLLTTDLAVGNVKVLRSWVLRCGDSSSSPLSHGIYVGAHGPDFGFCTTEIRSCVFNDYRGVAMKMRQPCLIEGCFVQSATGPIGAGNQSLYAFEIIGGYYHGTAREATISGCNFNMRHPVGVDTGFRIGDDGVGASDATVLMVNCSWNMGPAWVPYADWGRVEGRVRSFDGWNNIVTQHDDRTTGFTLVRDSGVTWVDGAPRFRMNASLMRTDLGFAPGGFSTSVEQNSTIAPTSNGYVNASRDSVNFGLKVSNPARDSAANIVMPASYDFRRAKKVQAWMAPPTLPAEGSVLVDIAVPGTGVVNRGSQQ
jgi:hypothetical protein